MNEKIKNAVSGEYTALHDLYKSLAKAYIEEHLDFSDLNEFVKLDYRLISLIDLEDYTLEQKKTLIASNIEAFYELYKDHDLELFKYTMDLETCYPNILSTMLNTLTNSNNFSDVFEFVFENIDKFGRNWSLSNYLTVYPTLYTKEQLDKIINHDVIKYAEFICDYDDSFIPYDKITNTISKSILFHINNDNDYFYEFIEKISFKDGGSFVYIADELVLDFTYDKILTSIKNIIEKDGDFDCVKTLINICIQNDWLQVFNDTNIDYMSFVTAIYLSKTNLTMSKINNYDEFKFVKYIQDFISYAKWNDVKRFISFKKYLKLKIEKVVSK